MEPVLRFAEAASGIVQSAESTRVVNFIAVSLVMFLMAVVWQLISRK